MLVVSVLYCVGGWCKGWCGWVVVVVVLLVLGSVWNECDVGVSWLVDYVIGKGEVCILWLVDGSEVELDV